MTKRAPVQGYAPGIPWALHLEAYEVYSKRWGPQPALIDLEGRNCRGGFHVDELDEFIPGWRDRADGVRVLPEPLRHSTRENGDCPHWCKACASEAAARGVVVDRHQTFSPAPTDGDKS